MDFNRSSPNLEGSKALIELNENNKVKSKIKCFIMISPNFYYNNLSFVENIKLVNNLAFF